ncbi:MAG: hypothetical protein ACOC05_01295 [Oceanicaulis sp.]
MRALIVLSVGCVVLAPRSEAQSHAITFDVEISSITEGVMRFDDHAEKDLYMEAVDDTVSVSLYCLDDTGVTASAFKCGWGGLTSGDMVFGVSTNDADQADWLVFNCTYGWINSGSPIMDICEERSY